MRGLSSSTAAVSARRSVWVLLPFAALFLLIPTICHGLVSFDESQFIDPAQALPGEADNDGGAAVAGDGAGTWVAVWHSISSTTVGRILVSRSTDNGVGWSSPSVLDPSPGAGADVQTDGAGVWVAAWSNVGLARSTDNGLSWTGVAMPPTYNVFNHRRSLATDGGGAWVMVWHSNESLGATIGNDDDILVSRSIDNGLTWSSPVALNTDAATDDPGPASVNDDRNPSIATDGIGVWVTVWQEEDGTDRVVVSASSSDDGLTWTSPVVVGPAGDTGGEPDIATDGVGTWVSVWDARKLVETGQDSDVLFSRSFDGGATWSTQAALNATASSDGVSLTSDTGARIVADGRGNWYCLWTSNNPLKAGLGNDLDVFVSRSTDGAATWTYPSAVDPAARGDSPFDLVKDVAFDGVANWLVSWDRFDVSTGDVDVRIAGSRDHCSEAPAVGCLESVIPGRSRVTIKNRHDGRAKIIWKWAAGEETTLVDLGDPTTSSDYVFCLYDEILGSPRLELEQDLLAATYCKGGACWEATSSGYKYKDRKRRHNATDSARLRLGDAEKAKIKVRAVGPTLGPPSLPLAQASTVTVQLNNLENGLCWQTLHSSNTRNDSDFFKARSD